VSPASSSNATAIVAGGVGATIVSGCSDWWLPCPPRGSGLPAPGSVNRRWPIDGESSNRIRLAAKCLAAACPPENSHPGARPRVRANTENPRAGSLSRAPATAAAQHSCCALCSDPVLPPRPSDLAGCIDWLIAGELLLLAAG
jgi:hypothetical protein